MADFERNKHEHIVLTLIGLDLIGQKEVERLVAAGYGVAYEARCCFVREDIWNGSYDKNHRLTAGQVYKVALVPGDEIKNQFHRTKIKLRNLGKKYGYGKPLAGFIPRLREAVSNKQMEEMGFAYIASPHYSIDAPPDNYPCVFVIDRERDNAGRERITIKMGAPDDLFYDHGAFAFPMYGKDWRSVLKSWSIRPLGYLLDWLDMLYICTH